MNFQLGQTGIGTTIPTRSWSIKVFHQSSRLWSNKWLKGVFPHPVDACDYRTVLHFFITYLGLLISVEKNYYFKNATQRNAESAWGYRMWQLGLKAIVSLILAPHVRMIKLLLNPFIKMEWVRSMKTNSYQTTVDMITFFLLFGQITQVSCYDTNLAPSGCTQYFYGSTSGTINSFNWANLVQLANQAQHVCIR